MAFGNLARADFDDDGMYSGVPNCTDISDELVTPEFETKFTVFFGKTLDIDDPKAELFHRRIVVSDCEVFYSVALPLQTVTLGEGYTFFFLKSDYLDNGFPDGEFSYYTILGY